MLVLRWALRAAVGLFLVVLLALTWLTYRYHLELGTAVQRALRPTATFTVDPARLPIARYARVLWLGHVPAGRASEISGLAVSRRDPDLLWTINDSGDGPRLYAIGMDGRARGTVEVRGALNFDWEDLAAFELDGVPYLLIADTGDNLALRPAVTLYVVKEPALNGERFAAGASVSPSWTMRVRLEGGPEDCEAVGVDAQRRRVLLLNKRAVPPTLYAVDLEPRHDDPRAVDDLLVARRLTKVAGIPQPTDEDLSVDRRYGAYKAMVTALDIAPDGSRAVVFTYKEAYLFERAAGETWARAFARLPQRVRLPRLPALEAGAFGLDGRTLFFSSENLPAPIFRIDP